MTLLYILLLQLQTIGAIEIDWDAILTPIGDLFLGNESTELEGIIGNQIIAGLFIFMVLFLFTLMMGLGMLIGSVAIIPALFAIFQYVPTLQIIVAIICGLIFGFALNKIVRR